MALEPSLPKIRNARTQAVIERETFWQITAPIVVALLVVAALLVLVIMSTVVPVQTGALADVSLMFLVVLYGGAGLLIFIIGVALCVAVWYGIRELPFLFKRAQDFVWIVAMNAKTATRQVDSRVVEVHLSMAALDSLYDSFMELVRPRKTR
ncbi:MAG: hypothetical protein ACT4QE_12865 [Anaerolineales bacterium]